MEIGKLKNIEVIGMPFNLKDAELHALDKGIEYTVLEVK